MIEAGAVEQAHPSLHTEFPIDKKTTKNAANEDAYEAFAETWRHELEQNWQGGYTQMPDEIRHDPTLSPRAKIVYEALLSFMWFKTDKCFPSQKTLASATGYSIRTVIRALQDLYERGYIEKWRRGQGDTNYYFINPLSFVRSFRRIGRGKGVLLQVNAPEHLANVETSPPSDVLSRLCQVVTSENDKVTDSKLTSCQMNQTNPTQMNLTSIASNHSTAASGEDVGGTAIGNANDEPASNAPTAKMEGTNQPSTSTTPSKPNHNENRSEMLAGPVRTKALAAAKMEKMGKTYTKAEAIAAATGIPAEHLAEMGVAQERPRRPIPDFIINTLIDFAAELGENPRSVKSSITRATKLYYFGRKRIGRAFVGDEYIGDFQINPEETFLNMLDIAKAGAGKVDKIRYHTGLRLNRMPVFFACLENLFGLSQEELALVRSDEFLYEQQVS